MGGFSAERRHVFQRAGTAPGPSRSLGGPSDLLWVPEVCHRFPKLRLRSRAVSDPFQFTIPVFRSRDQRWAFFSLLFLYNENTSFNVIVTYITKHSCSQQIRHTRVSILFHQLMPWSPPALQQTSAMLGAGQGEGGGYSITTCTWTWFWGCQLGWKQVTNYFQIRGNFGEMFICPLRAQLSSTLPPHTLKCISDLPQRSHPSWQHWGPMVQQG